MRQTAVAGTLPVPTRDRSSALSDARRRRLAVFLRRRFSLAMFLANVVGAIDVYVLLTWILPVPGGHDPTDDLPLFVAFMAFCFAFGGLVTWLIARPVLRWLESGHPAGEHERDAVLALPMRQAAFHATMWAVGAALFGLVNGAESAELGRYVAVTVAMAGLTTCALTYLLAERLLRPITALALTDAPPERPVTPGIAGRLLWSWLLATGVPLVGLALVGIDILLDRELTPERIAGTILALTGIALGTGLLATIFVAKSVAQPVSSVRRALAQVQDGELDVTVRVDDASEIGLLQNGFNQMPAGLRERERLRDLFGRHVGEDVARAALDRDGEARLGGEVREVAVLFVDLIGSTRLAQERPPERVVALLNRFFGLVVDVVGREGGWVNKFEGDAAMCVFGAPVDHPDPAGAALRAARGLRARLAHELPEADMGIGVSAGPAVAGNVGAEERFEYTVIGDPVNEAARLCERAKSAPGRVLASEAVLGRARDGEADRWSLGEAVTLRGRAEPTRLAQPA